MSTTIIQPTWTTEMVHRVFSTLTNWEVRKRTNDLSEMRYGQQDGYIMCLIDLFSSFGSDNNDCEQDVNCLDLVDKIANSLVDVLPYLESEDDIDMTSLNKTVDHAVTEFLEDNMDLALESLKSMR